MRRFVVGLFAAIGIVVVLWLSLLLFYGWCYNRAASGSGPM